MDVADTYLICDLYHAFQMSVSVQSDPEERRKNFVCPCVSVVVMSEAILTSSLLLESILSHSGSCIVFHPVAKRGIFMHLEGSDYFKRLVYLRRFRLYLHPQHKAHW